MIHWTRWTSQINSNPKAEEYAFLSSVHGTLSRADHIVGHKSGLNKYKMTDIIPCIFSNNSTIKLEVKQEKKWWGGPQIHRGQRTCEQRMKGSTREFKKK